MTTIVSNRNTEAENKKQQWFNQAWLEPRLVVVTLLAMILGVLANTWHLPTWVEAIFAVIAFIAGGVFGAKGAIETLIQEHKLDIDMLMVAAALGAAVIGHWAEGAMLLFLFSLSNVLQDYAIGRSRNAIKSLFKLYPEQAKVKRDDAVVVVPFDQIHVGDVVLIEPGERIPVDGEVIGGRSSVDQSPITGESMPVEKSIGDQVFAGTLNKQGVLDVQATRTANQNTLARIIKMVEEAQEAQAPTERFLEQFEQYYAAFIIFATLLIIVIPPALFGVNFVDNFYRAMVLMTVASPCALVISVPAAFISAIASAARDGILLKGGAYLEAMATIKAIAFDKTGTLTKGQPAVVDVISCCHLGENELLSVAASVEARSEHPLAKAIVQEAENRRLSIADVHDFEAVAGQGVISKLDGKQVKLGSINYLLKQAPMPPQLEQVYTQLEAQGKTVIGVVREGHCEDCGECEFGAKSACDWMGIIALADELRPEAAAVVRNLRANGIEVAMFTGDNPIVAQQIADQLGIQRVHAGLMPEDKVTALRQLQAEVGAVAMVGDGVNDAPALAMAEVGIAMGAAGTDVALETADVVLMGDKLELIERAIILSKKARRVVWQNIAFSLAVIVILIMGALVIDLPLPLGVLGHEGSTVIVVLNGLITLLILPEIARRKTREINPAR
ncbi:MAG: cadmium-translocating P-type ATPase [Chloroflexi bacterium]|nr:MAG: cadmium-translocating P-type ATPase [Chloroflexota bacterium]